MIRLDEYGYCLEDYVYSMENGIVKEISYTLHNEKNQDVEVIGVYNENGKAKRSIVLWPQTNPNVEDHGYLNGDIEEMRLYLDDAVNNFNFENITVYRYETAKKKTLEDYIVTVKNDDKDVSIYVDRSNVAVYDSCVKVFKIFSYGADGGIDYSHIIEQIRILDFGIVTETAEGDVFVLKGNEVTTFHSKKVITPIESLELHCTGVTDSDGKEYSIKYDSDDFVETVLRFNEFYSRNEGEEQIMKNHGKIGEIKDSIYPTMIRQNPVTYKYPFLKLWTHDKLNKDAEGNIITFQRRIFVIRDEDKLLNKLRSNLTRLSINY